MSQAANDLNLTFVVDEQQGPRLVRKLHASMIRRAAAARHLVRAGNSCSARRGRCTCSRYLVDAKRDRLLEIATGKLNAYVYDAESIREATGT